MTTPAPTQTPSQALAVLRRELEKIKSVPNAGMTNAEHAAWHMVQAIDRAVSTRKP